VRDETSEMRALERIGAEELRGLAHRLFAPERLHLSLVGPVDSTVSAVVERTVRRFTSGEF
jgi:hypothetical protein